jgi:hypothetical protein
MNKANKADVTSLDACKAITDKFGPNLGIAELLELATKATKIIDHLKKPSTQEKNTRHKLYQWFHNNWTTICPEFDNLELEEEEQWRQDEQEHADHSLARISGQWQTMMGTFSRTATAVAIMGLIANIAPDSLKVTRTDITVRMGNTNKREKIPVGGGHPLALDVLQE